MTMGLASNGWFACVREKIERVWFRIAVLRFARSARPLSKETWGVLGKHMGFPGESWVQAAGLVATTVGFS